MFRLFFLKVIISYLLLVRVLLVFFSLNVWEFMFFYHIISKFRLLSIKCDFSKFEYRFLLLSFLIIDASGHFLLFPLKVLSVGFWELFGHSIQSFLNNGILAGLFPISLIARLLLHLLVYLRLPCFPSLDVSLLF